MNDYATDDKSIRIDNETHLKLKIDAAKKGKTIKQYLRELILNKKDEKTGKGK